MFKIKNLKNKRKGFTLIETLLYVTIIGIAIGSFISFSISITNSRNKTYVVQEVQVNARTAVDFMSRKIRSASGVNIGASTFGSDPGVLSLTMDDPAKNPTIFRLNQNDGILEIVEGVSPAVPVTSSEVKITNLVFDNLSGNGAKKNIGIDITVEYANKDSVSFSYFQDLRTAVSLRR